VTHIFSLVIADWRTSAELQFISSTGGNTLIIH